MVNPNAMPTDQKGNQRMPGPINPQQQQQQQIRPNISNIPTNQNMMGQQTQQQSAPPPPYPEPPPPYPGIQQNQNQVSKNYEIGIFITILIVCRSSHHFF